MVDLYDGMKKYFRYWIPVLAFIGFFSAFRFSLASTLGYTTIGGDNFAFEGVAVPIIPSQNGTSTDVQVYLYPAVNIHFFLNHYIIS